MIPARWILVAGDPTFDGTMQANISGPPTVLLVESDVIVRFVLAEYLRACGAKVIEAPSAQDAKAVLIVGSGVSVDTLMCDAQLAGDENGFALAQWVRRHRPNVEVILTSSIANKADAAGEFCDRYPDRVRLSDSPALATRINNMLTERKRRMRPPSTTAAFGSRRKRR
jgi:CheY-like chemotaxis protein